MLIYIGVINIKCKFKCIVYACLVTLADFFIKRMVLLNIKGNGSYKFLNGMVEIVYTENTGAAFGIFNQNRIFLIIVNAIFLVLLAVWIFSKYNYNKIILFFLSLIIGGGAGNLLDRLIYGYVIDYIKLSFFEPVCNFADYCITFGVSGLIFYIVFIYRETKNEKV